MDKILVVDDEAMIRTLIRKYAEIKRLLRLTAMCANISPTATVYV